MQMEEETSIPEVSEKNLAFVRDIIRTLTKTLKTFTTYPKDNPIYQKFAAELFEKFGAFFQSNDELVLDVGQYSLSYMDKEVYHNEEKTDNIALLLFADGIRQLQFYKEITLDEIIDFIDILRSAPKSEADADDDIVTLFWEKDIRNMGYNAVEDTVEDELVIEETLLSENNDAEGPREGGVGGSSFQWRPASFSTDFKVDSLSDRDLDSIKADMSGLGEDSLVSSSARLFFELLSSEADGEAFPEIMQNLSKIIDFMMKKKDLKGIIDLINRLREISEVYQDPGQREMIARVFTKAGSVEVLKILFSESGETGDIRNYLLLLDKEALPAMLDLLGELQDRKHRKLLCEVLAEVGRKDIELFSESMRDERWYVVRNIVMVLGMIKEPSVMKHLETALRHSDPRVRREAARALEGLQAEGTNRLLLMAMKDADLAVRITVFKAMRRFRDPALLQAVKERATREELKDKPFSEKKEIIETLAVLGGENVLPILSDLFKKGWLIEKNEVTEIRACAAYGLGRIGTAEAVSLLEKETDSRKGLLREACLKVLRELRQSGNISR